MYGRFLAKAGSKEAIIWGLNLIIFNPIIFSTLWRNLDSNRRVKKFSKNFEIHVKVLKIFIFRYMYITTLWYVIFYTIILANVQWNTWIAGEDFYRTRTFPGSRILVLIRHCGVQGPWTWTFPGLRITDSIRGGDKSGSVVRGF